MVFDCTAAYSPTALPPRLPIVGMGLPAFKNPHSGSDGILGKSALSGVAHRILAARPAGRGIGRFAVHHGYYGKKPPGGAAGGRCVPSRWNRSQGRLQVVRETVPAGRTKKALGETDARSLETTAGPFRTVQKLALRFTGGTLPFVMEVRQNYPNPFNIETTIPFHTFGIAGGLNWKYSTSSAGRWVAERDEGYLTVGSHAARFSADELASGVYFYR